MITQQVRDIDESVADPSQIERMHETLRVLRIQMHDLGEWQRAQDGLTPLPTAIIQSTQQALDVASDEATRLSLSMSDIAAQSWRELAAKADALEYLLPEEPEPHILLCRSMCGDIRRLASLSPRGGAANV